MSAKPHDLVIVGGGITGACIARDAAMRGLSVALVDKGDFGHATTAASSKLIHGGLRYLKYLQFGVVRESLRERRIWANIAPHMLEPVTFLIPTLPEERKRQLELTVALHVYDALSFDRNRLDDPEKGIPRHHAHSREDAIALIPELASTNLNGARSFTDYQMYFPERLALECVLDAVAHGGEAANYAQAARFLAEDGRITGVLVEDALDGGAAYTLRGSIVVNAGGAWADRYMAELGSGLQHPHLIRSKGIHLLTRPLTSGYVIRS
jgi:glycerol-3-phosphate dehydrogenase